MGRGFRLGLNEIHEDTRKFQPRNPYANPVRKIGQRVQQIQQQLEELINHLNTDDKHTLEPLKVWLDPLNDQYYVVDGHHRLEAYRQANWRRNKKIPCVVIEAKDAHEALIRVFKENTRSKLGYTAGERVEAAWKERCRLERAETPPTTKHMVSTLGISSGTASNFNGVIKKLKAKNGNELPFNVGHWKTYAKLFNDDGEDDEQGESTNNPYTTRIANDLAEVFERHDLATQTDVASKLSDKLNDQLIGTESEDELQWSPLSLEEKLEDEF